MVTVKGMESHAEGRSRARKEAAGQGKSHCLWMRRWRRRRRRRWQRCHDRRRYRGVVVVVVVMGRRVW